jgi:hypothetical protein
MRRASATPHPHLHMNVRRTLPFRMTTGFRLSLGFGVLLFLLASTAGVSLHCLNGFHATIQRMVTTDREHTLLSGRALALMNAQIQDTLRWTRGPEGTELRARLETRAGELVNALDTLERRLGDTEANLLLSDIRLHRRLSVTSLSQVAELLEAGEHEQAYRKATEETIPALEEAIEGIRRFNVWQGESLAATGEASLHQLEATRRNLTLLLFSAASFSLLLAVWIARAVLRPLGGEPEDVRHVAERIATGDINCEIPLKPDDHESLLAAMKAIQRKLSVLIEQHSAADRALRENEVRFREMIENLRDWVWEADANGRLTYASPQVQSMLGYSPEELIGRTHIDLMPREEADRLRAQSPDERRLLEPAVVLEVVSLHKDGHRVMLERSGKPFFDARGRLAGYRGIDREITGRKEIEAQRLAEQVRLREALVREVHHRIKNNLQTVIGLLRREASAQPQAASAIEVAIAQVQAVAIVHGLYGRAVRHSVLLCELLPEVVNGVQNLMAISIELSAPPAGEGGLMLRESETVAVALILNELITNAAKHAAEDQPGPRLQVRLTREGPCGHVQIVNTGQLPAGFDFEARRGLGTGLGLVRALQPVPGMSIRFQAAGEKVRVSVTIEPPVVGALQGDPADLRPDAS